MLDRLASEVPPLKFQEIERPAEGTLSMSALAQEIEGGEPGRIGRYDLTVDQERAGPQRGSGSGDRGEARGPVVPLARKGLHARLVPPHHQAEPVVLDLVQPTRAGWRRSDGRWPAR